MIPYSDAASDTSTSESSRNCTSGADSSSARTEEIVDMMQNLDLDSATSEQAKVTRKHHRKTGSSSSVTFSTIEIRSFPMILGDNPACDPNGPPLTIDWDPINSRTLSVDRYEKWKVGLGRQHRRPDELKIGGFFRLKILRTTGDYNNGEIVIRMNEMDKIRNERKRSIQRFAWGLRFKGVFSKPKKHQKREDIAIRRGRLNGPIKAEYDEDYDPLDNY